MFDRLQSALVAVSLAVLVWLYARSRDQELLDNVPIPVDIELASGQVDHYDLEITGPCQVPVSFRGPPSRIRELRGLLQRGEVRVAATVVVPEDRQDESRYLDTVRVDAADVHVPPGIMPLVSEGRNRIPVALHRLVERRLPVRLDPAPADGVSQVTLEPDTVRVRGPQDLLDRVRAIPTQAVAPPPGTERPPGQELTLTRTVPLVQELDGRPIRSTPAQVAVRLTLPPKQKLYELTDVPVQFLCPANFALRPQYVNDRAGKVNLKFWGPVSGELPAVVAFIDLTGRNFEPGLYADEPLRLQLPKDAQLAQNPPRSAAFRLVPLNEPGAKGRDLVHGP